MTKPLPGQIALPLELETEEPVVPVYQVSDMELIQLCVEYYHDWQKLSDLESRIVDAVLSRGEGIKVGPVQVRYSNPSDAPGVQDYLKALESWQKSASKEEVDDLYAKYGKLTVSSPKDACSDLGLKVTGALRPAKATVSVKE